jgi:hypothetical protein
MSILSKIMHLSIYKIIKKLGYDEIRMSKNKLTLAQINYLKELREDNKSSSFIFKPAKHWEKNYSVWSKIIEKTDLDDFENSALNLYFSGFSASDIRLHSYLIYCYYNLIKKIDKFDLLSKIPSTTPLGVGGSYEIDGNIIGLDQLLSIDEYYNLIEFMPEIKTEKLIIADIGAGWGRLGHVICTANPNITFCIFDMPESLLISSTYLPKLLSKSSVSDYKTNKQLVTINKDILKDKKLWFLGAQDLLKVESKTFDLVTNVFSFQEMSPEQVMGYFDIIDKTAKGGFLYLRELWTGATHSHGSSIISGHANYPFKEKWDKLYFRNTRFSKDFFDCAYKIN